jgi:WD40 repeat protein
MEQSEITLFLKPKVLKPAAEEAGDITRRFAMNKVGRMVASATQDRAIRLYDVSNGEEIQRLQDDYLCTSIAFSPRGDIIASGGVDRMVKLWDIRTAECVGKFEGHTYPVLSLSFSPDGSKLLSGSGDTTMIIWDVDKQENILQMKGHSLYIVSCEWSPVDEKIISGSIDSTIGLWDAQSGENIQWIDEHRTAVQVVRFSIDGSLVASGSSDHDIIIWDASGDELKKRSVLRGHSGEVRSLVFSTDKKYLVSGSGDKALFVWNLETGEVEGEGRTESEVDGIEWIHNQHGFFTSDGSGAIVRWDITELEQMMEPFEALLEEIKADTDGSRRDELIQKFEDLRSQYDPEVLRDKRVFYVLWQCKRGLGLLKGKPRRKK